MRKAASAVDLGSALQEIVATLLLTNSAAAQAGPRTAAATAAAVADSPAVQQSLLTQQASGQLERQQVTSTCRLDDFWTTSAKAPTGALSLEAVALSLEPFYQNLSPTSAPRQQLQRQLSSQRAPARLPPSCPPSFRAPERRVSLGPHLCALPLPTPRPLLSEVSSLFFSRGVASLPVSLSGYARAFGVLPPRATNSRQASGIWEGNGWPVGAGCGVVEGEEQVDEEGEEEEEEEQDRGSGDLAAQAVEHAA